VCVSERICARMVPAMAELRRQQPNAGGKGRELAPLSIIRTETALSRFPIHSLSKRGGVDIHITRANQKGEIDFSWEVSPNPKFGQPRQLAYKLDTTVINRILDELGRPLPRIIRLGNLREIAHELCLGGDTNKVRKALRQNAFAAITAKMTYRGSDGTERALEADFTRYSIVFSGENLPDGRQADAVYLILNEPYWQVLNNAPVRPLDYDYLKKLPPIPQRFYEIISRQVFIAIRHKLPSAKLLYSEYCTQAPQQRYFDYDHFKKQMYKVHRIHLLSRYLKSIAYEETTDGDGTPNWWMHYVPGAKAVAEYRAFNRKHLIDDAEASLGEGTERALEGETVSDTSGGEAVPEPEPHPGQKLVCYFHSRARGDEYYEAPLESREVRLAGDLVKEYGPEKALFIVDYAVEQAKTTKFQMRTFGALSQYVAEAVQAWDRRMQGESRREREEAHRRQAEDERQQEGLRRLKAFSKRFPKEYESLYRREKAQFLHMVPSAAKWDAGDLKTAVQSAMIEKLRQQGELGDDLVQD
jgi:hypothetical protein